MSFSVRTLFKEINKKYDSRCQGYIKCAMDEIDKIFENIEIDDTFYNEYYKLKRITETINSIFGIVLSSVLTGTVVSLAIEAEKELGILGFTIFIFLGILVCIFVVKQFPTKQRNVLEPYVLKKMEELIDKNRSN